MLVLNSIDINLLSVANETTIDVHTYRLVLFTSLWVMLATWAKRCHDCDYNGWWMFVPFFNFIFLFKKGDAGYNRYGDNPRNR